MVGFLFLSLETDRHVVTPSINFRASMTLVLFAIDDDDCGGILTWFHELSILYCMDSSDRQNVHSFHEISSSSSSSDVERSDAYSKYAKKTPNVSTR